MPRAAHLAFTAPDPPLGAWAPIRPMGRIRNDIMRFPKGTVFLALLLALFGRASAARASDVKLVSLADIQGTEVMRLEGIGVVTGLNGTGDKAAAASSQVHDMMARYNLQLNSRDFAPGSVALVHVSATILPSNAVGQFVPAQVSAINGARNLAGGFLTHTALHFGHANAHDSNPVYAVASGRLHVGPQDPLGGRLDGSPSSGAQVIRQARSSAWNRDGEIWLNLRQPSYTDAVEIAQQINSHRSFEAPAPGRAAGRSPSPRALVARVVDDGRVYVRVPDHFRGGREPEFLAVLENIQIPLATPPKILVRRSGQGGVVVSGDVQVARNVTIARGNKTISLMAAPGMEFPEYPDPTQATLVPMAGYGTNPDRGLNALINTLNSMGMTTQEIGEIFADLVQQGVIRAEIEYVD